MCGYEQYYFIKLIHAYDYAQHCHHFIERIHIMIMNGIAIILLNLFTCMVMISIIIILLNLFICDYEHHCHHFIKLIHMYDYEWYYFRNGHVRHVEASVTAVSVVAGEAKGALVYSFTWRAKGATMMSTLTSEGQLHIICIQNKLVWVLQASSNSMFYIGEGSVCV